MDQEVDFARIIKVALTGAALAVAADFAYTNYGEEMKDFISELIGLLAKGDISNFPGDDTGAPA